MWRKYWGLKSRETHMRASLFCCCHRNMTVVLMYTVAHCQCMTTGKCYGAKQGYNMHINISWNVSISYSYSCYWCQIHSVCTNRDQCSLSVIPKADYHYVPIVGKNNSIYCNLVHILSTLFCARHIMSGQLYGSLPWVCAWGDLEVVDGKKRGFWKLNNGGDKEQWEVQLLTQRGITWETECQQLEPRYNYRYNLRSFQWYLTNSNGATEMVKVVQHLASPSPPHEDRRSEETIDACLPKRQ